MPCSRGIMRNVSHDNIEYVDAWSRTTQYGDDKPVHPDALPESYVDVGRWRDYRRDPASRRPDLGPSYGSTTLSFVLQVAPVDECTKRRAPRGQR